MDIIKYNKNGNVGYFSNARGLLTNFIFKIISVDYRDNLYGSFTISVTNDNENFVNVRYISVCGPNSGNFKSKLLAEGLFIHAPGTSDKDIVEIFSFEFDQYIIAEEIKKIQKEQLAYGNQSVALENSENISFEDKKTLRSHYSTKQTQLQERIDKLTLEFSVVDSKTIVQQRGVTN